ncbi:MAG: DMT family transporter [Burkholderiales bacterium]|nr:DMT family transporter [Burkholderiales bacterium]
MSHSRAVAWMVLVTLMWSIAGVVTRHLDAARSFEVTFWRSLFNALALVPAFALMPGPGLVQRIAQGGRTVWISGLCWTVMYTNFMLAITMTTVATVLVTMSIAPLVTALFARLFLHHRLPRRTWVAIGVAGCGIAWMFGRQALEGGASLAGIGVALGVPLAGATNWTLLQHIQQRHRQAPDQPEPDMLPAVFIGATLSALLTLPLAWPVSANAHDLGLLGLLGVVQLAIPCLIAVRVARVLPAPEVSLLCLLEVVFGVLLAWVGAGEAPGSTALAGGALVIGALLANETLALRERRLAAA